MLNTQWMETGEIISEMNDIPEGEMICADIKDDACNAENVYFLNRVGEVMVSPENDSFMRGLSGVRYHKRKSDTRQGMTLVGTDQLLMPKHFLIEKITTGEEEIITRLQESGNWDEGLKISEIWNEVKGMVKAINHNNSL